MDGIDPWLVAVLLINFYCLATTNLRAIIYAVAVQGVLLAIVYLLLHGHDGHAHAAAPADAGGAAALDSGAAFVRLLGLTLVMALVKGLVIPRLLLKAMHDNYMRWQVEGLIGTAPTLLVGLLGTAAAMLFARSLPLEHPKASGLVVSASLATVLAGALLLTTKRTVLAQVLGYLVLENGIFLFGLLLVEAMPILVELGVLLDLFVGVFVMGILINHVSREFPAASSEHLSALKE